MILVSYYDNMFRSIVDHLEASVHMQKYNQYLLCTMGSHITSKVYVKAIKNIISFCKV